MTKEELISNRYYPIEELCLNKARYLDYLDYKVLVRVKGKECYYYNLIFTSSIHLKPFCYTWQYVLRKYRCLDSSDLALIDKIPFSRPIMIYYD